MDARVGYIAGLEDEAGARGAGLARLRPMVSPLGSVEGSLLVSAWMVFLFPFLFDDRIESPSERGTPAACRYALTPALVRRRFRNPRPHVCRPSVEQRSRGIVQPAAAHRMPEPQPPGPACSPPGW